MNRGMLIPLLLLCAMVISCNNDDDPTPAPSPAPLTQVKFDPALVPYATLSEYNFFKGNISDLEPQSDVLPYDLITPLFTDYAKKKRFVWFEPGKGATYNTDHKVFDFEDGAVIIKNFYYEEMLPSGERRILETRLLYKIDGEWHFAEYVWNEDQTDALLDMDGSYRDIAWIQDGVQMSTTYRIPSGTECLTCHKSNSKPIPIGPKPQNMDKLYNYKDGVKNQLAKWAEMGYLKGFVPSDIDAVVAWDDLTQPLELRVRAYLDINCASCHEEGSHCDYRPMRFAWKETVDRINQGVCVPPDEDLDPMLTYIIAPGNIARSMVHFRINTTEESVRMPLLGRSMIHTEAVQMITEYINSLTEPC